MNEAFRPKGGNGVHGLFDDAGALVRCAAERAGEDCECTAKGHGLPYPKGISSGHASDVGHWLAMTRWKIADAA